MSTKLLWHGTPDRSFSPAAIEPRVSWLNAIFLTGSIVQAAYYAGKDGVVHGFEIDSDASVLRATANTDDKRKYGNGNFHYPTAEEWDFIVDFLSNERKLDLTPFAFPSLDPELAGTVNPPLGPHGQLSWEALMNELSELMDDGEALLQVLGFDGLTRTERTSWTLFDRMDHFVYDDTAYGSMCRRMKDRPTVDHLAVAMFRNDMLLHRKTLKATEVAEQLAMGSHFHETVETDLEHLFATPFIPARAPRRSAPAPA